MRPLFCDMGRVTAACLPDLLHAKAKGSTMGRERRTKARTYGSAGKRRRMSRAERKKQLCRRALTALAVALAAIAGIVVFCINIIKSDKATGEELSSEEWTGAPKIDVQLLDENEYSRPGLALENINGIVIHYTANPGSSAQANRDYFEGLKESHETKASSHFVVGLEGEIIQCIPSNEISYASNERNSDTLSIECCHPDETGKYTDATYGSVVNLTAWLCARFGLTSQDVIRHYDVTGKLCPLYFVEHEDAWEQFRRDVDTRIAEMKEE